MANELVTAYSATVISISARFVFMYLLYTKKSTNLYSLVFSMMNIVSSSLWIRYSQQISDMPLLIRGSSDLLLFSISAIYILYNRLEINKVQLEINKVQIEINKVQIEINKVQPENILLEP
jgi:hypothetical protein